jgi:hypothetical protein
VTKAPIVPNGVKLKKGTKPQWPTAPGSAEAVSKGCRCSQARNKFGEGVEKSNGRRWFTDPFSPLHESSSLKQRAKKLAIP